MVVAVEGGPTEDEVEEEHRGQSISKIPPPRKVGFNALEKPVSERAILLPESTLKNLIGCPHSLVTEQLDSVSCHTVGC